MKRIGIVGGIAPESTVAYYRGIISGFLERNESQHYPEILIDSIDLRRMLDLITTASREELAEFLLGSLIRLERSGADFALFASNTPHLVFDYLAQRSPLPLLSIVEETAKRASLLGLKRAGLFGTRSTMQADFYRTAFLKHNIGVVVPNDDEQEYIHSRYMSELVPGVFKQNTKSGFLDIARQLKRRERIDSLILGGTEIPLLFGDEKDDSLPYLDTTQIHIESVLNYLFQKENR